MTGGIPFYWRLSSFYLLYFGLLGTLVPYWSLYLKELGFAAAQIGTLMALPQLTKLVAPNLWGWLADRTGQRLRIIRLGNLLAAVVFCFVFYADDFWSMALLLAGFSFFWNAVLAQFEVVTLATLENRTDRYSHVRVWGSIGFIVAVAVIGKALDMTSIALVPLTILVMLWVLWLCTLTLPADRPSRRRHEGGEGLLALLKKPPVLAFFGCCFLMQMSHGPYYTFYTIYLDELGVSRGWTGALWALGVISEVVVFMFMHRLMQRFRLEQLLVVSLALAGLRWVVIGTLADSMVALVLAQTLHAASFGSFHAAGIGWVHRTFGYRHAGQGQALYSSIGFGAGWALGAWLSGIGWDYLRGDTFLVAAAVSGLATLVGLAGLRYSRRGVDSDGSGPRRSP